MIDYKAVCTVLDEENWGTNSYSGTMVIDGVTYSWLALEDIDRQYSRLRVSRLRTEAELTTPYKRRHTHAPFYISKRKDYSEMQKAICDAIKETREIQCPKREDIEPPPQPQPSAQPSEDDGPSMEEILGGGQQ
jgi:hypothetical protein